MTDTAPAFSREGSGTQELLRVSGLAKYFDVSPPLLHRLIERKGRVILKAVDGVTFTIPRGKTFSLVGESGCGKSTLARCVVGLYRPTRGEILFDGNDTLKPRRRDEFMALRRRTQMIFQDPFASLNPRWKVKDIIAEPIRTHRLHPDRGAVIDLTNELLRQVKLSPDDGEKYPHEFSGGQRQRIAIARGLAISPDFLVCDEPTSALDVSVQAQILNLMKDLQQDLGLTYLFISHNLAVVNYVSDLVGVMYLGRIVEWGPKEDVLRKPRHPYTRLLIDTIPSLHMEKKDRVPVAGEVPNPLAPPSGCTFHPRCPFADARCASESPKPALHGNVMVACHKA